jgi:hypothetical protein
MGAPGEFLGGAVQVLHGKSWMARRWSLSQDDFQLTRENFSFCSQMHRR